MASCSCRATEIRSSRERARSTACAMWPDVAVSVAPSVILTSCGLVQQIVRTPSRVRPTQSGRHSTVAKPMRSKTPTASGL
jgi:hypothetical protein